ncbi:hypothetical protein TrVE_jg11609 [Triparma verrucosa]|uniref:Uncharacterized protein n=1 Tax=Triparma verrucosa TaxID=1606542 RepID=A0A9W7ELA1_9STRA|nr:hypothetical protein TrVE_jg11609 [Triparma verrucosa]
MSAPMSVVPVGGTSLDEHPESRQALRQAEQSIEKDSRFQLSTRKILRLISPVLFALAFSAILPLLIPLGLPYYVVCMYAVLQSVFIGKFFFFILTAFSNSWAAEFEHVEGERDHALFENSELRQELVASRNHSDNDISKIRDHVGETLEGLENSFLNPDEILHKVQKLDDKMAAAAEARESRLFLAMMTVNGTKSLKPQFILIKDLMEMIKRMSICKCTMTNIQQSQYKVKLDPRALRLICHNFTTFARKKEDSASSYKAFATVDIQLPSRSTHEKAKKKSSKTIVEVKVKYMGQPLTEEEIRQAQDEAEQFRTKRDLKIDDDEVSPNGSITPNSSYNIKTNWNAMEEGKTLSVAYQVGTCMGGSLSVEKEFRFSTISFKYECAMIGAEELTPESDGEHKRSLRRGSGGSGGGNSSRSSPAATPPSVGRPIDINNSNNIQDIVDQFPTNMKIVILTDDVEQAKTTLKGLGADQASSTVLKICPENVDIIMDVAMGSISVDKNDDRNVRRLKPLEVCMADVVIINESVGSDSKGKRWLATGLANALSAIGYKGVFCIQCNTYDKKKLKGLQGAPNVHAALTKQDPISRIKVNVVLAIATPSENDNVKRRISSFKRNLSFQRPKGDSDNIKNNPAYVAHRISERQRRKSSSAVEE